MHCQQDALGLHWYIFKLPELGNMMQTSAVCCAEEVRVINNAACQPQNAKRWVITQHEQLACLVADTLRYCMVIRD